MSKIKSLKAREILDSKGEPAVEVRLETDLGFFCASSPSGVSRGANEARELRDGDERYRGKGVLGVVKNVNEFIAKALKGKDPVRQEEIDNLMKELDGTNDKSRFGVNAILPVSIAICRAGAEAKKLNLWKHLADLAGCLSPSLPTPGLLLIEGGLHSGSNLEVQEFMIVSEADSFKEKLRMGVETYHLLGEILEKNYGKGAKNIGLEGAFAPFLKGTREALEIILEAAEKSGYEKKTKIILDMAAASFFKNGFYRFENTSYSSENLLNFYNSLIKDFPLLGIEDPFGEEEWLAFSEITERWGKEVMIIGDDLLMTNSTRIERGISLKSVNGLILKPNQVGTITETIEAANLAKGAGWKVFAKHRSGETNDDFLADLAVGLGADYLLAGAPTRGERTAKYNRLLEIEEEIEN